MPEPVTSSVLSISPSSGLRLLGPDAPLKILMDWLGYQIIQPLKNVLHISGFELESHQLRAKQIQQLVIFQQANLFKAPVMSNRQVQPKGLESFRVFPWQVELGSQLLVKALKQEPRVGVVELVDLVAQERISTDLTNATGGPVRQGFKEFPCTLLVTHMSGLRWPFRVEAKSYHGCAGHP
ncbi:hypothetical protein E4195_01375 [Pseudomonas putida]|nr:hypothetical protein E4195_01375 [Pseudomonas putida]